MHSGSRCQRNPLGASLPGPHRESRGAAALPYTPVGPWSQASGSEAAGAPWGAAQWSLQEKTHWPDFLRGRPGPAAGFSACPVLGCCGSRSVALRWVQIFAGVQREAGRCLGAEEVRMELCLGCVIGGGLWLPGGTCHFLDKGRMRPHSAPTWWDRSLPCRHSYA